MLLPGVPEVLARFNDLFPQSRSFPNLLAAVENEKLPAAG